MSEMIINTATTARQVLQQQVQAIPEELFDIQPAGFNNTIRWNVGHMIYWMDKYSPLIFDSTPIVPDSYETLFNSGTKPWIDGCSSIEGSDGRDVNGAAFLYH